MRAPGGAGLPPSPADGQWLVVVGTVLDATCAPAVGARLEIHHTDALGAYGPKAERCCYYAGVVRTDENGRFRLETVRPGRYAETNAPPAHIHLAVRHPDGELNTEIVFVGDEGVPTAPVDGYSPVHLQGRDGGDRPPWRGEVTLVLVPGATAGA